MRRTYQQPATAFLPLDSSPVLAPSSENAQPAVIIHDRNYEKLHINDALHYGGDAPDNVTPTAKQNVWTE